MKTTIYKGVLQWHWKISDGSASASNAQCCTIRFSPCSGHSTISAMWHHRYWDACWCGLVWWCFWCVCCTLPCPVSAMYVISATLYGHCRELATSFALFMADGHGLGMLQLNK